MTDFFEVIVFVWLVSLSVLLSGQAVHFRKRMEALEAIREPDGEWQKTVETMVTRHGAMLTRITGRLRVIEDDITGLRYEAGKSKQSSERPSDAPRPTVRFTDGRNN